jgi:hypothetical protein
MQEIDYGQPWINTLITGLRKQIEDLKSRVTALEATNRELSRAVNTRDAEF